MSANDLIIFGFSTHSGVLSALIRRAEGAEYSHVYVRFYSVTLDRWLVYQASGLAVNFIGFERFVQHNRIVEEYRIEATPEERQRLLQFCVDEAGVPYGTKWLIGMAWIRMCALWFNRKVPNPFPSGKATLGCSKLGGYMLKLLGKGYSAQDLENADPKWINQQIRSWDRAVKVVGDAS